jgi:tRNA(Ile)-lysidine synthase
MNNHHQDNSSLSYDLSNSFLYSKFKNIGLRQGWWAASKPIVLAVSGGCDSVAMLWLFKMFWPGKIIVAHLEHGIRGKDSLKDAEFVSSLCGSWKLGVELKHLSVPDLKEKGESIEAAARRLRYKFLHNVVAKYDADYLAVAHNADDLAETVLHNLIRGTGPYGLVGIPETRGWIIRPVIGFYRQDLERILKSREISWCEDLTNSDVTMTRNRIRHQLVPWIEDNINKQAKEHIVSLAGNMTYFRTLEEEKAMAMVHYLGRNIPGSMYSFRLEYARRLGEQDLSIFLRAVLRVLGLRTISRNRLEKLVDLVKRSGRWQFQCERSIELCAGQGYGGFVDGSALEECPPVRVTVSKSSPEGTLSWGGWEIKWTLLKDDSFRPASGSRQCILPFYGSCDLGISSYHAIWGRSGGNIPWWIRKAWPVISLGSKIFWSPSISGDCSELNVTKMRTEKLLRVTVSDPDSMEVAY